MTVCLVASVHVGAEEVAQLGRHRPVRLYASLVGSTIIWEDARAQVVPDGPQRISVVLAVPSEACSAVFRRTVRFVAVWIEFQQRWSDRVPVVGTALSVHARLVEVEARVSALEAAWTTAAISDVFVEFRDAVDDHERRFIRMEASGPMRDLESRATELSHRLDRLDRKDGRLVRIEDELEDLVGPEGDVVDFEARLSVLERALGVVSPSPQDLSKS
jgi:hypothetical protein